MGRYNLTGQVSSITGKATTATARSLTAVKTKLENKIRKMAAAKNLTAKQKEELANLKSQLRDVRAEISSEASTAGRSLAQKASDKKKFKGYDPSKDPMAEKERPAKRLSDMTKEELQATIKAQEAKAKPRRAKGGMMKKYNKGGYANCGASVAGTQGIK